MISVTTFSVQFILIMMGKGGGDPILKIQKSIVIGESNDSLLSYN